MRNEKKFTPGPWCWMHISNQENGYIVGTAFDSKGMQLSGEVDDEFMDEEIIYGIPIGEKEASIVNYHNAILIASAPDMSAEIEQLRGIVAQSVAAMDRGLQGLYTAQNYAYSLDNGHELREKIKKDIEQVLAAIDAAKGVSDE